MEMVLLVKANDVILQAKKRPTRRAGDSAAANR
jgi:hypothetical protein